MPLPRVQGALAMAIVVVAAAAGVGSLAFALAGLAGPAVSEGGPPVSPKAYPVPQAWLGVLASALVIGGMLGGRLVVAWVGALLLEAFALLFVFGVGGWFLPVGTLLLLLLAARAWREKRRASVVPRAG
jgi:hypothetical protein